MLKVQERVRDNRSIANTSNLFRGSSHCATSPPSHRRISTISSTQDFLHREPPLRILSNTITESTQLLSQPNTPCWTYPNQYNPYPQSYNHNFQNNFHSLQSQWGFTSPESNFQPTCPPYPPYSQYFQDSYSVRPVQNRKPSILEMSMRESKQQSQKI